MCKATEVHLNQILALKLNYLLHHLLKDTNQFFEHIFQLFSIFQSLLWMIFLYVLADNCLRNVLFLPNLPYLVSDIR